MSDSFKHLTNLSKSYRGMLIAFILLCAWAPTPHRASAAQEDFAQKYQAYQQVVRDGEMTKEKNAEALDTLARAQEYVNTFPETARVLRP
jgi:hypothetical protein